MKISDKLIFREYFKTYYFLNIQAIKKEIKELESREFAYVDFNDVIHRHIAIKEEDFERWIEDKVPRDFYYSSGYYLFPDKPIDSKVWIKGDIIFDIDIDHIETYSPRKVWICLYCDEVYFREIKNCERCHKNVNEIVIFDDKAFLKAKEELDKLITTLSSDLGINTDKHLSIYFSGGRGFHIHVTDPSLVQLRQKERLEIKDYITYEVFDITYVQDSEAKAIKELRKIIEKDNVLGEKIRDKIIKLIDMNKLGELKELLKKEKKIKEYINTIIREKLGVHIDSVVTVDLSRLIRVPYSLHGKTGLIKTKVDIFNIDQFHPFNDAVYNMKEKVRVFVRYLPQTFWLNKEYKETFKEYVEIPISLAIYLVGRGLAYGIRRI